MFLYTIKFFKGISQGQNPFEKAFVISHVGFVQDDRVYNAMACVLYLLLFQSCK